LCIHVHAANGTKPTAEREPVLLNKLEFTMKKFFNDESGATAIEYGLIAAAMGLALVTAMPSITSAIVTKFSSIGGHVSSGT
jgi:pilus assembly protein Flp/PilA